MMRYALILGLILCGVTSSAKAFDPQFFETLYDVPVMEGLLELEDSALTFDKPGGRISQAMALAEAMTQAEILAFYDTTLPQMGWNKVKSGEYQRELDKLLILFEKTDHALIAKFMLSPIGG